MSGSYITPESLHDTRLLRMTIVFARRLDSPIILCIDSKCLFAFLFTFSSSVLGSAGDSAVCMHDPDAALLGTERAWIWKFECESMFRQNRGVRISPFRCGTTCRKLCRSSKLPNFAFYHNCISGCLRIELCFRLLARGSPLLIKPFAEEEGVCGSCRSFMVWDFSSGDVHRHLPMG